MQLFQSDAEIDAIGRSIVQRTLQKLQWTHAAHLAAAFWVLTRADMDATRDMPGLIRAYNEATGVANTDTSGYHHTITLASLRVARDWLAHRGDRPLHAVLNDLLASDHGRSDWLLAYSSKPLLFSAEARRSWIEPDLRPLPFA